MLDQVDTMPVLLPYMTDGHETLYEKLTANNNKKLLQLTI